MLAGEVRLCTGASFHPLPRLARSQFETALAVALYAALQSVLTRAKHLLLAANSNRAIGFLWRLAAIAHLQRVLFYGVYFCVIAATTAQLHPLFALSNL